MKPLSIEIIPALPGFLTIYDDPESKDLETGDPVIAWRVETCPRENSDELISSCTPLTAEGDVASNCIGVQNPDMTVTVFHESYHKSIEELKEYRYPKN